MSFGKTRWIRLSSVTVLALVLGAVDPVTASLAAEAAAKEAPDAAATGIAVGTAVTMGTMQAMTTPSASEPAACSMSSVTVGDTNYYHCAPNWYQKAYVNGELSYVSVAAPPGF